MTFPYFPLYVKDWLTGQSTALMPPEAKGAFVDLLAHAWLAEPPCTLPDDDRSLAKLSGLGRRWAKFSPELRAEFEIVDGRLRNAKQWSVWQEMMAHRERRSQAGKKGNDARWERSQCDPIESPNGIAKSSPSSSSSLAIAKEVVEGAINRLSAAANRGLADHPIRPQLVPRIMAASGRSREATEVILTAEIPLEFAEAEIYRIATNHTADGEVCSLKFFVGGVCRAWQQEGAKKAALSISPKPSRNGAAMEAFGRAADVVRQYGDMRFIPAETMQALYADERMKAALKEVGGLPAIRDCKPDRLTWLKKEFAEAFNGAAA